MRQKATGVFLFAALAAGCAGSQPAMPPGPSTATRSDGYLDIYVKHELNRNCFGPSSAPATQPARER